MWSLQALFPLSSAFWAGFDLFFESSSFNAWRHTGRALQGFGWDQPECGVSSTILTYLCTKEAPITGCSCVAFGL